MIQSDLCQTYITAGVQSDGGAHMIMMPAQQNNYAHLSVQQKVSDTKRGVKVSIFDQVQHIKRLTFPLQPMPQMSVDATRCNTSGKAYKPYMTGKTTGTAAECQQRCMDTSGCYYFSSFLNGDCRIATGDATPEYHRYSTGWWKWETMYTRLSGSIYCFIPFDSSEEHTDATYTDGSPAKASWQGNAPPKPGSAITLSNRKAERFQRWSKEHQLFENLMGPFSIVNPDTGLAIAVANDGLCTAGGELMSQTDDPESQGQLFYLGYHGSIFSSLCRGLVVSVDKVASVDSLTIKLDTFRLGADHLKWSFAEGTMKSVKYPDMVVDTASIGNAMALRENANATLSHSWKRINTRLMDLNGAGEA